MSNRQLTAFLRSGGLTNFHVGGPSRSSRQTGSFARVEREVSQRFQFSASTEYKKSETPKHHKDTKKERDDDSGDDEDEHTSKKKRIYRKGEDAGAAHINPQTDCCPSDCRS